MSYKSLRDILFRTDEGTSDGLNCEGEVAEWGRERKGERAWFGVVMTLKRQ